MALMNLMEDIVSNVIDEILKNDKSLVEELKHKDSINAYVLNRVPPKYVTSERGILHGMLSSRLETQQKTDIFMLTYEAFELFKKRRDDRRDEHDEAVMTKDFPHIIGQVLEETTFSVVPGVEVSLSYNGELVKMVDPDWINPYLTNSGTKGYFHFWPKLEGSENPDCESYTFTLKFHHKDCIEKEMDIEVDCKATAGIGMSFAVPIVLLGAKEGVDVEGLIR